MILNVWNILTYMYTIINLPNSPMWYIQLFLFSRNRGCLYALKKITNKAKQEVKESHPRSSSGLHLHVYTYISLCTHPHKTKRNRRLENVINIVKYFQIKECDYIINLNIFRIESSFHSIIKLEVTILYFPIFIFSSKGTGKKI